MGIQKYKSKVVKSDLENKFKRIKMNINTEIMMEISYLIGYNNQVSKSSDEDKALIGSDNYNRLIKLKLALETIL